MASLQRKNTGLYYLIWTDRHRTPTQISESLKTTEQSRAKYLQRKLEIDYHDGKHNPWFTKWYERAAVNDGQSKAIDDLKDLYIKEKSSGDWSDNTIRTNRSRLDRLVRTVGKDTPINRTREDKISRFIRSSGSSQSQASLRTTVIAFLNWCHERGWLDSVPKLPPVRVDEEIPEYLSDEELQALYEKKLEFIEASIQSGHCRQDTTQHWMIDAWRLAAATGMRKDEIINLQTGACSEDFITIGYRHRTKSRKQRRIPYLFEAKDIVQKHLDPEFRASDPMLSKSDHLFGRKGRVMADKLSRKFTECRDKLWPDRKEITLHSLRHTFAIRYLTAPVQGESTDYRLYKLQRILGHAERSTTEVYLKAIPYDLQL